MAEDLNRYSNYPSYIDKLRTLPEYQEMSIEDKQKIERYEILSRQVNLTPEEKTELMQLIDALKDKMLQSQDWNMLVGAIYNIELYFKNTVLKDLGHIVDVAEQDIKVYTEGKKNEIEQIRKNFDLWFKNLVDALAPDTALKLHVRLQDVENQTKQITTDTDMKIKELQDNVNEKTEELQKEVQNKIDSIKLTADNVTITDNGNHFTSGNVEGALKECMEKAEQAFQSGVNVKNNVVTALTSKGISVTTNDDWNNIISKIKELTKFNEAQGHTTRSIYGNQSAPLTIYSGLTFTPKLILISAISDRNTIVSAYYLEGGDTKSDGHIRSISTRDKGFYFELFNGSSHRCDYSINWNAYSW